jgi:hypothetical protein
MKQPVSHVVQRKWRVPLRDPLPWEMSRKSRLSLRRNLIREIRFVIDLELGDPVEDQIREDSRRWFFWRR